MYNNSCFNIRFSTGRGFDDMNLDELNENEDDIDEEDEKVFEAYRSVSCLLGTLVNSFIHSLQTFI